MAARFETGGIPKTTNKDLQNERSKATFTPEMLTYLLDGGKHKTERRRYLEKLIEKDPTGIFSNDTNELKHRTDRYVSALAKHVRLIELCRSMEFAAKQGNAGVEGGELILDEDWFTLLHALADDLPTSLHWIMFVPNIMSLCDEEQQKQWLPLCRNWQIMGCYAQTELGHGSNVRALETTATFVKGNDGGSWKINSPTLTSIKFWPGTLGRTANYAMLIARLIDGEGKDHGVHNFLVPLRSRKDHKLLPGVTTGDIGPKIGYNNIDNGFAKFDNVIIPRRNMAMKFASVDENGIYTKKNMSAAASKVAYITMMQVRAYIIMEAGKSLAKGLTIAIRYSAVRRQGFKNEKKSKVETQILDYTQQQHRLFPLVAASYCFFFTGKKIMTDLTAIENRLMAGDDSLRKNQVADIHASTSALKSFTSTITGDGLEDARKSCGGHGFLQASGLPELVTTYLQSATVEGDNQMLPMQVVKVLLNLVSAVQSGNEKDIAEWNDCDATYLVSLLQSMMNQETDKCVIDSEEGMMKFDVLLAAYKHRAARLLFQVSLKIYGQVQEGVPMEIAWNSALVQMGRVSRAHSLVILLVNFYNGIKEETGKGVLGDNEAKVLTDLAVLFGLYWIEKESGEFLEDGYMSADQCQWVRAGVLNMLNIVRPNIVPLVDANDFSDFRLKSTLGRKDGNVYPAIVEASKKDPLNVSEPGPGYDKHLKRLYVDGVGVFTGTASRL